VILTPKALANFSPGLERSDNLGVNNTIFDQTLKGFEPKQTLSGLIRFFYKYPGLSLALQPWAEISQRLRRYSYL